MSHEGKMRRGEFYSNKTNVPECIKDDVEYFLENTPKEEVKEEVKEVKKVKKGKKKDE